jgi:hypothetical protein
MIPLAGLGAAVIGGAALGGLKAAATRALCKYKSVLAHWQRTEMFYSKSRVQIWHLPGTRDEFCQFISSDATFSYYVSLKGWPRAPQFDTHVMVQGPSV